MGANLSWLERWSLTAARPGRCLSVVFVGFLGHAGSVHQMSRFYRGMGGLFSEETLSEVFLEKLSELGLFVGDTDWKE